jgi:hypothetical protein
MKNFKFDRKLTLNKNTIANLNTPEMSHLRGGDFVTKNTCDSECCTDYNTCEGIHTCVGCVTRYQITCACPSNTCTQSGVICCA